MTASEPQQISATRPGMQLLKKAIAGAAVAAATELAFGRRLYLAYEAIRRLSSAGQRPVDHPLPPAEQAVEGAVDDIIERSAHAIERHRPAIERARARTRARLEQPGVAAVVAGGAVLGAISALGMLPVAMGAGTAYLVHRRLVRKGQAGRDAGEPKGHSDVNAGTMAAKPRRERGR